MGINLPIIQLTFLLISQLHKVWPNLSLGITILMNTIAYRGRKPAGGWGRRCMGFIYDSHQLFHTGLVRCHTDCVDCERVTVDRGPILCVFMRREAHF